MRWSFFWSILGGTNALGWAYFLNLAKHMFGIPWKSTPAMTMGAFGWYSPRKQLEGPLRTDAPYYF